ncbi:hypothetical protein K503DRAFT_680682 [Rhizopogon vinicolor AM-OR11-026]|uniref:Ribonuclease H1 N-terminal domain-containing protein n=1 Tax=Rhizopogon vinicolor AM-OR11-026 TaxID=1314800 RepID=A0A1B7NFH2_9AGAM|nr:hypothetical protein K503DRAFT_680682 [Rhizopogon vinicolor AM-OR11-026]
MPKAARNKYYAVRIGREGPKIYDTWAEVINVFHHLMNASLKILHQVSRWPGAVHKSFRSRVEAEQWLALPRASEYLSTAITTLLSPEAPIPSSSMSSSAPDVSSRIEQGTPAPRSADITLSDEQKGVLRRVERGENIFFTGSAGA